MVFARKLFYLNPFVVLFYICWFDDDSGTKSIQRLSGELPLESDALPFRGDVDLDSNDVDSSKFTDGKNKSLKRRSNFDVYYMLAKERINSRLSTTTSSSRRRSLFVLATLLLLVVFSYLWFAGSSRRRRQDTDDATRLIASMRASSSSSSIAALSVVSSNYWPEVPFLTPVDRIAIALDDAPTLFTDDDFVATPRFQATTPHTVDSDPYRILLESFQSQYNRRRLTNDEVINFYLFSLVFNFNFFFLIDI